MRPQSARSHRLTRFDKSDRWHRGLLRRRCERPCGHAAEQIDEFVALHGLAYSIASIA